MENKKADFSEWYNEIIDISTLSDKRYPVKGMNVWLPYGWKVMKNIDSVIRKSVDAFDFDEVSFPVLITRDQLEIEFEHVKGFKDEIFWVTKGGSEPLDVELALRPTSESAMYPMFSLWIRSHADLPLKTYQVVNVYRYETKHTRTFIRVREIHFFEAHTAHVSYDDAEKQMEEYKKIWRNIAENLCLPYVVNKRPDWDKFPGADYSLAFDTIMPSGRALQIGTIHEYGSNFSKTYDVKYLKDDGTYEFVHQTTFGLSERLLAAIIGIHGDDQGLIFPPVIAPVQVIIVPIPSDKIDIEGYGKSILETLKQEGIRAKIDDREGYTPGFKFNDWEMRGVPIRIEIGEREVEGNYVTIARRGINGKVKVNGEALLDSIPGLFEEVRKKIMERAADLFKSKVSTVSKFGDLKKSDGMSSVFWCGSVECSDKIENETELKALGFDIQNGEKGKCIVCGKEGRQSTFARSY